MVEARRTSDVANAPFTLTATILGASVEPNPDIIQSAQIGVPVARSYTATVLFGAFTGRMSGHDARQRTHRYANHRRSRAAAISHYRNAGIDFPASYDWRNIRSGS